MGIDVAEELVVKVLDYVISDRSRFVHFLSSTGFDYETIKEAAQSRLFMLSVLEYASKDERLLQVLGEQENVTPDMIDLARARLAFQAVLEVTEQRQDEGKASDMRERVQQLLRNLTRRS
jgi:hypothetical protein